MTMPPPSPPQSRSPRNGLRTYLGMRKRSTLLDEPTPEEPNSTAGKLESDLDKGSREQRVDRAEIIVSPPTPSSSVFLHSAPRPSEVRFGDLSTPGKPAARFVKSHSKRHSLSAACTRKSSPNGHPTIVCGNADEYCLQANGGRVNERQIRPLPSHHHLQQHPWSNRSGTSLRVHHSGKSGNRYGSTHLAGALYLRCSLKMEMMWVVKQFTRSLSASLGLQYPSYHSPPLVRARSEPARTKRLISSPPQAAWKQSDTWRRFARSEDQRSSTPIQETRRI